MPDKHGYNKGEQYLSLDGSLECFTSEECKFCI